MSAFLAFIGTADLSLRSTLAGHITPDDVDSLCKLSRLCRERFNHYHVWCAALKPHAPLASCFLQGMGAANQAVSRLAIGLFQTRALTANARQKLVGHLPLADVWCNLDGYATGQDFLPLYPMAWKHCPEEGRKQFYNATASTLFNFLMNPTTVVYNFRGAYDLALCVREIFERPEVYELPPGLDPEAVRQLGLVTAVETDSVVLLNKFRQPGEQEAILRTVLATRDAATECCRLLLSEMPAVSEELMPAFSKLPYMAILGECHPALRRRQPNMPTLVEQARIRLPVPTLQQFGCLISDDDDVPEAQFFRTLAPELRNRKDILLHPVTQIRDLWQGGQAAAAVYRISLVSDELLRDLFAFCFSQGCVLEAEVMQLMVNNFAIPRQVNAFRSLQQAGGDLRLTGVDGRNLADWVAEQGRHERYEVLAWLQEQGIRSRHTKRGLCPSLVHVDVEIQRRVIAGVKRERHVIHEDLTPAESVILAAQTGRATVVKRARVDLLASIGSGSSAQSPLSEALIHGQAEVLRLLIERPEWRVPTHWLHISPETVIHNDDPKKRRETALLVGQWLMRGVESRHALPVRVLTDLLLQTYFCGNIDIKTLREALQEAVSRDAIRHRITQAPIHKLAEMLARAPEFLWIRQDQIESRTLATAFVDGAESWDDLQPLLEPLLLATRRNRSEEEYLQLWERLLPICPLPAHKVVRLLEPRQLDPASVSDWLGRLGLAYRAFPAATGFQRIAEVIRHLPDDYLDTSLGSRPLLMTMCRSALFGLFLTNLSHDEERDFSDLLDLVISKCKRPIASLRHEGQTLLQLAYATYLPSCNRLGIIVVRQLLAHGHPVGPEDVTAALEANNEECRFLLSREVDRRGSGPKSEN